MLDQVPDHLVHPGEEVVVGHRGRGIPGGDPWPEVPRRLDGSPPTRHHIIGNAKTGKHGRQEVPPRENGRAIRVRRDVPGVVSDLHDVCPTTESTRRERCRDLPDLALQENDGLLVPCSQPTVVVQEGMHRLVESVQSEGAKVFRHRTAVVVLADAARMGQRIDERDTGPMRQVVDHCPFDVVEPATLHEHPTTRVGEQVQHALGGLGGQVPHRRGS
jgi:hypothetical protein